MNPSNLLRDELPYGPELEPGVLLLHRPFARSHRPHRDYSLAAMIDVKPINIDLASDQQADSLATRWANLLRSQTVGSVIDVRLDSGPGHSVPEWEESRSDLEGVHLEWQRRHVKVGMRHTHQGRSYSLRQNTVTIGLRTATDVAMPLNMLAWLQSALIWRAKKSQAYLDGLVSEHLEQRLKGFRLQLSSLMTGLFDLGLSPTHLCGQPLLDRLNRQLDPISPLTQYDEGAPLRDQLGVEPVMLTDTGCDIGGRSAHVLTPGRGIANTFPGLLSSPRAPEAHSITLDMPSLNPDGYYAISVAIAIPDPGSVINSLQARQGRAWIQRLGNKGQERADVKAQEQELSELIRVVTSGEESLLPTGVRMIVWDNDDTMSTEALTRLTSLGIVGARETYVGSTLLLQSLSLGTDLAYPDNGSLQGMLSIPSTHAAGLTPIWGGFRGDGSSEGTLLLNRLGDPVLFDPFAGPGSPHGLIVGLTRSGKSAATNTILLQVLPCGGYAFILDRYGSYKRLAELLGGVHFALSLDNPICLGMMDGPLDVAHRATVLTAMIEMCGSGAAGSSLDRAERAILTVLLKRWASQLGPNDPRTLSHFVECFDDLAIGIEGGQALCDELKLLLMPYYGDGEYAPFIDGPNELAVTGHHLVSVDIAGLLEVKEIEAVMVALFFLRFGSIIRDPALIRVPKYMIADEVAFLLQSPATSKFFLTLSRALARFKCSLITISQFLSDFDHDAGHILADMAGFRMIFRLPVKERPAMVAHGLGVKEAELIHHLERSTDSATCYLSIKTGETGVVRIVAPPEFITEIGQDEIHQLQREEVSTHA